MAYQMYIVLPLWGRDTLGDKSLRVYYLKNKSLLHDACSCIRSDLVWGGMWTSFLIQHDGPYDILSLFSFIFCRSDLLPEVYTLCDNAAFAKFVAAIGTTNSAAATMIFTKLTVSHEAKCCGDLFPRRVAATYRLVCPGL